MQLEYEIIKSNQIMLIIIPRKFIGKFLKD